MRSSKGMTEWRGRERTRKRTRLKGKSRQKSHVEFCLRFFSIEFFCLWPLVLYQFDLNDSDLYAAWIVESSLICACISFFRHRSSMCGINMKATQHYRKQKKVEWKGNPHRSKKKMQDRKGKLARSQDVHSLTMVSPATELEEIDALRWPTAMFFFSPFLPLFFAQFLCIWRIYTWFFVWSNDGKWQKYLCVVLCVVEIGLMCANSSSAHTHRTMNTNSQDVRLLVNAKQVSDLINGN